MLFGLIASIVIAIGVGLLRRGVSELTLTDT